MMKGHQFFRGQNKFFSNLSIWNKWLISYLKATTINIVLQGSKVDEMQTTAWSSINSFNPDDKKHLHRQSKALQQSSEFLKKAAA